MTYGTEGDGRPLAALCAALMAAGHETALMGAAASLGAAGPLGVPTLSLAGDMKAASDTAGSISGVVKAGGDFTSTTSALAAIANRNAEVWTRQVLQASDGADAIVASGLAAFVGLSVAERLKIKAIGAGLIPITPTAAFASPFLPPAMVPAFLNRFSHEFVNGMLWRAFRKAINAARASVLDLPPRQANFTDHPMLYGVSPTVLPPPTDWPSNARLCGQWIPPVPHWTPPEPLRAFFAAGDAPLYVGFGSMMGVDRGRLVQDLIEAVGTRRAVFNPGWSGVDVARLPANILAIGDTPHDWLFPRTSLVVHHGGSGTTHSAARAGVPSVAVPFAGDQPFWAGRLHALGVAPAPVSRKAGFGKRLAAAIAQAEGQNLRTRAADVGRRMAAEDGLADGASAIEALMGA